MFLDKYSQTLFEGASDFTREHGINLICAITPVVHEVSPLRDLIGPENVDGILFVSSILTNFSKDATAVGRLLERYKPAPCVSIGEAIEGVHSVTVDNRSGMSNAIQHLVNLHRFRKIGFVRGPEMNQDAQERFAAYQDVLKSAGIPYDPDLVAQGNWSIASGAAAIRSILKKGKEIEAVVCCNDPMAAGAISTLHARGMIVPSDVAVVGFDNINETGLSLTTVEQPAYEMGRRAARMLLDLARGLTVPEKITLAAELIIRQSCGCMGSQLMPALSPDVKTIQTDATPFVERRESILTAMAHALGVEDEGTIPNWLERIFDGFVQDITTGPTGRFLSALSSALAMQTDYRENAWQSALSVLRQEVLPCLSQQDFVVIAETLWHQAELSLSEATKKQQALQNRSTKASASGTPPAIRDTQQILKNFVEKLTAIGIERCFVVLFEGKDPIPEWARTILSFSKDEGAHIDARGERFPAHHLLPENLMPPYCTTLLALPLLANEAENIGLIFFERGRADGFVYESLRWQLSEQLWQIIGNQ
jgi:DNA-binding LacI/PurR family transcriptional regulator